MIPQCACCGGNAPAKKQWFNQDHSYGICAECFQNVVEHEVNLLGREEAFKQAVLSYGRPGVHHSLKTKPTNEKEKHNSRSHRPTGWLVQVQSQSRSSPSQWQAGWQAKSY